jgi:XRE family transcriptional regulator, regulator of sulfur utilization
MARRGDPASIGWMSTVEWLQWYDVTSKPGGVLDSEGHQRGSVECLAVLDGEFEVVAGGVTKRAKTGETLRYRSDRPYSVRCLGDIFGHATTGCILKAAVMD